MSVGRVNDRIVMALAGSTVTFTRCTTPLYVAVITADAGLVTEAVVIDVDVLCTPLLSVAELGTDATDGLLLESVTVVFFDAGAESETLPLKVPLPWNATPFGTVVPE
jgi:hypothetical protein